MFKNISQKQVRMLGCMSLLRVFFHYDSSLYFVLQAFSSFVCILKIPETMTVALTYEYVSIAFSFICAPAGSAAVTPVFRVLTGALCRDQERHEQKKRTGQLVHPGTVLAPPLLYWPAAHSPHAVAPVDSAS